MCGELRQLLVGFSFLAASRGGDFGALLEALDPDVVFRTDATAKLLGATSEMRGAAVVAEQFAGKAALARAALVNGTVGVVVAPRGRLLLVLQLTFADGRINGIEAVADPDRIRQLDLAVLDA